MIFVALNFDNIFAAKTASVCCVTAPAYMHICTEQRNKKLFMFTYDIMSWIARLLPVSETPRREWLLGVMVNLVSPYWIPYWILYPRTRFTSESCTGVQNLCSGYSIPLPSFVKCNDSAWWMFQHYKKGDDSAWWVFQHFWSWCWRACIIVIWHFTVYEKVKICTSSKKKKKKVIVTRGLLF